MAISARKPQGKEYTPAPKGRFQAVLIGIVDRGEQPNKFKDGNPLEPKLSFHFEINKENEEGENHQISKWVTNSTFFSAKTGKMSALVQMLTEWLDVSGNELKPAMFDDLECLLGLNVRLRIVHTPKEDGSGVSAKIASFEPWEDNDGDVMAPTQSVGDNGLAKSKTLAQFWAEVNGTTPARPLQKPAAPAEEGISEGQIGVIRSAARQKLENDTSALLEFCMDAFGKKLIDLTKVEAAQLTKRLQALPDPLGDDDSVFDDDGDATDEEVSTLLSGTPAKPAPPRGNKKAEAEAGYANR